MGFVCGACEFHNFEDDAAGGIDLCLLNVEANRLKIYPYCEYFENVSHVLSEDYTDVKENKYLMKNIFKWICEMIIVGTLQNYGLSHGKVEILQMYILKLLFVILIVIIHR